MKLHSITFETIGSTTLFDLRIKRYEFLKTAKNLKNLPRKSEQTFCPKMQFFAILGWKPDLPNSKLNQIFQVHLVYQWAHFHTKTFTE